MLPDRPAGFGPPCSDRGAWERAAPSFQKQLAQATSLLSKQFPAWSEDAYLEYSRTGARERGEKMLTDRQNWLAPLVVAECAEGRGRFLPILTTVLDQFSQQKSWTYPAHDEKLEYHNGTRYFVELNSAELSHNIAETIYLLGDRLPPATKARALAALEQRVFAPMRAWYASNPQNTWLTMKSNWNAVCLEGVTGAALAVLADRNDRALFAAGAEYYYPNYLGSFTDDGYAEEGLGYWDYGFLFFSQLREELWQATRGQLDLFTNTKARKVALFGIEFPMFPNNAARIGDAKTTENPDPTLLAYVRRTFSVKDQSSSAAASKSLPPVCYGRLTTSVLDCFPSQLKSSEGSVTLDSELRTYYPDPGILVSRPAPGVSKLAITIKSDGNVSHSHNDIGSYSIAVGATQPVGDPGGPAFYTAQTFSKDRLNSSLLNSFGHPVPMIGGRLQLDATKVHPKVLSTDLKPQQDTIVIDMTPAYDAPELKKLERTMHYFREGPGAISIEDHFELTGPTDIDEALPTHGSWRQINANTLEFTANPEHLIVVIDYPGQITTHQDLVNDYGNPFTRVGIRVHMPGSGVIKFRFQPAK